MIQVIVLIAIHFLMLAMFCIDYVFPYSFLSSKLFLANRVDAQKGIVCNLLLLCIQLCIDEYTFFTTQQYCRDWATKSDTTQLGSL